MRAAARELARRDIGQRGKDGDVLPMRIKASGGIRGLRDAMAMVEAGASRIGTSSGVWIMQEAREVMRSDGFQRPGTSRLWPDEGSY